MPQFVIIARDQPNAFEKRSAARTAHLEGVKVLKEKGSFIKAAAFLNDQGEMVGSIMLFDFPTKKELDHYVANEPYILQNVWGEIEISEVQVAPI